MEDDEDGFPTDAFDTDDMTGETPERIAAALTAAAKMHADLQVEFDQLYRALIARGIAFDVLEEEPYIKDREKASKWFRSAADAWLWRSETAPAEWVAWAALAPALAR